MYNIIISNMDDEGSEQSSGGLYDVSPDFSPDFLSSNAQDENSAENTLRNNEDAAASAPSGFYEGARDRENNVKKDGKSQEKADSASKLAEKGGAKKLGGAGSKLKMLGMSKAAIPIIIIVLALIIVFAVFLFLGQSSFAKNFKALQMIDRNSTADANAVITDNMINGPQLCGGESSGYGDVAYNNMDLTSEQIQDFEDAGFKYSESEKTLSLELGNGTTEVITCDTRVGKTKTGESLAIGGSSVTDVDDGVDYEAVKSEIIANLGLNPDTSEVIGFSEALDNSTVKEKYMIATRAYRGDISGWFTPVADIMVERLGVSRDFFSDFEKSGSADKDREYVDNLVEARTGSNEGEDTSESLEERVNQIAENSEEDNCGAISAFNDIEGITAADQTYKQILISAMYLESIDKTTAGYGTESPMATFTTMFMKNGAASSKYMQQLFGGKELEQGDSTIKDVVAQASGADVDWSAGVDEDTYRSCAYVGNTTVYDNAGFISTITSLFQKVWSSIKNWLSFGTKNSTETVATALAPQIAQFEKMKANKYYGDDIDGEIQGNGIGFVTERYFGEHSKSAGQNIGNTEATLAFKHIHDEVVAERAWYDQQTKSPFDTSSPYTFLGSIVKSLTPLAVSTPSLNLTSTATQLGNIVSGSVTSLLPTSSALSDAEIIGDQENCVIGNSTTGTANNGCNSYYVSDPSILGNNSVQAFDNAANMRYDTEGTYIGGYAYDDSKNGAASPTGYAVDNKADVAKRSTSDPMYRDGPVNSEEANYEHHWPEVKEQVLESLGEDVVAVGTPHGCESNWYHETRYKVLPNGTIDYSKQEKWINFDWPIEWKYSRGPTNFEYAGYESGWPNVLRNGSVGQELAENDEAPGECMLDFYIDEQKLPVINDNSALALYQIASGQRSSEWGSADDANVKWLAKSDFTQGRLHPCTVNLNKEGDSSDYDKYCQPYIDNWEWGPNPKYPDNMEQAVANSKTMSRWISGSAFTITSGNTTGGVNVGTVTDNFNLRFEDPTRGNANFWEEQKYYQSFSEMQEWLDSAGFFKDKDSPTASLLARYYDENPLDQSYEGILARYSGKSKEQVIAVLDLLDYAEFLANYNPADLYPLAPTDEQIIYESETVIADARAENAVLEKEIIYDEIRNRAVTV